MQLYCCSENVFMYFLRCYLSS